MKKIEVYLNKKPNNRTFGIRKTDFNTEQLEALKTFANYIKNNNIKSDVKVSIRGYDSYKIINRINIYIENKYASLIFRNIYCGGVYGTDRIFETLYNFEYLLNDLIRNSKEQNNTFNHYENYSLSNHYQLL